MRLKNDRVEMCSGPLLINILRFSIPVMLTALFQQLYTAADTLVVGRYAGQNALAGVGTSGTVVGLVLNVFLGLSAGVSVVLGKALGAKDDKNVHAVGHTAVTLSSCVGALVSVLGMLLTDPILVLLNVPEEVVPQAQAYLRISFLGKTASLIYNFGAAILRAKGDAKRPLFIVTVSGLINVALNLFFVIVLRMEADGVALATVISQVFSAVTVLILLRRSNDSTRLSFRQLRLDMGHLREIARVGIPCGVQTSLFSLSNAIMQSSINSFGAAAMAGGSAASSIFSFLYVMLNAYFQTAVSFISQNIGAKNYGRINRIIGCCMGCVTVLWVFQSAFVLLFGKRLLGLYLPGNEEAIRLGTIRLTIVGCAYGLAGYMEVTSGALRGMGKSFSNMLTTLLGVCGIRILWTLFVFPLSGSFAVLFLSFPISWLGTFLLNGALVIRTRRQLDRQIALEERIS